MKYIITGDTHCNFSRFKALPQNENIAVIILGDVGLNFFMRKKDYYNKQRFCNEYPFTFYCVRGNHEARPQDINGMKLIYDNEVQGEVWMEEDFPRIRYFKDWGEYNINGHKVLVVGGAYSVDKYYRLAENQPWFSNEQLSFEERQECLENIKGNRYDLVLTHTCPYNWQPIDLFISTINNSTVDPSMELWLEDVKNSIEWNCWLFGHYHDNRTITYHVEMLYDNMLDLEEIFDKWNSFDKAITQFEKK